MKIVKRKVRTPHGPQRDQVRDSDRSRDRNRRGADKREKIVLPEVRQKTAHVLERFSELWATLLETPIHLDSALSQLPAQYKGILAQIVPAILLRPTSFAEALGVGVPENEPWKLDPKAIARWRPAQMIAERLYEGMSERWPSSLPQLSDFPSWMTSEWQASWDSKTVDYLVKVLGREAPLSLRARQSLGARGLLERLTSEKLPVRVEASEFAPFGVRLASYAPLFRTRPYLEGDFEVQDEGSQWMSLFALSPEQYSFPLKQKPGEVEYRTGGGRVKPSGDFGKEIPKVIVDACAGAGGKSLAIADALKGKGRIFAYDTSEKKLQALRRRATRMGLNNIQPVHVKEGSELEGLERFKGAADVVLVDAPCSGWGVLRRNPDIKWRQKGEVLKRMPEVQLRLLGLYSELVSPGGRLVYGVCTFRIAETQDVVKRFLERHPSFELREGGFLGPGPCDGFFMQSLIRK